MAFCDAYIQLGLDVIVELYWTFMQFGDVGFGGEGKTRVSEETLSEQSRKPDNSTRTWRGVYRTRDTSVTLCSPQPLTPNLYNKEL